MVVAAEYCLVHSVDIFVSVLVCISRLLMFMTGQTLLVDHGVVVVLNSNFIYSCINFALLI